MQFGNTDVQFDPVGFAGEIATRLGQKPSRPGDFWSNPLGNLAVMLGQTPTPNPEAQAITPPNRVSSDWPTLSMDGRNTDPTVGMGLVPPAIPDTKISEKSKELDGETEQKAKDAIVPPKLLETAKAAKIKDPDMGMMGRLIEKGINPITNPEKFLAHFDALAEQNDMLRSWGPLEGIRDILSPDAQALRARQKGLLEVGTFLTQKILEAQASRINAPQDAGTAAAALGRETFDKHIPLTDIQKEDRVEAPRRGDAVNMIGPMEGLQNYHTPLEPWQQDIASNLMKGLSTGALMRDAGGEIIPTSFANVQGRQISPAEATFMDRASLTPPDQPIPTPPSSLPASAVNKIIDERGNAARATQQANIAPEVADWASRAAMTPADQPLPPVPSGVIVPPSVMNKVLEERGQAGRAAARGPEYEKRVESLAAVESRKKHGKTMSFFELTQKDPALAERVRTQADLDEPKHIYSFQQQENLKRQIAAAGPVKTAQAEAERDQPVHEPQLWRDPYTGKAADPEMTTRQAQDKKFVKLRPDQVETVNQLTTIDDGLKVIEGVAKKILNPKKGTVPGEILRAAGQAAYMAYLRMTGDPDIVLLDSVVSRMTAPLVKSQGDTANIAVAEREMFAKALVNNQGSAEAVLANLQQIKDSIKRSRAMMGFKSKEELVQSMLKSGMTKDEIMKALKERGL